MSSQLSAALLAALQLDDDSQVPLSSSSHARQPEFAAAAGPKTAEEYGSPSTSADEMTCSICLQHTELEEISSVKGCDHTYCVKCILRWAAHRERPTCPQCKAPFDYLSTYYNLDGSLNDFPQEESVCLLKRARFFTEYMQSVEKGKWKLSAEDGSSEWRDYEPFYQEYDDAEAVEDFYFSPAAGRARIVLGNRRFGENGFVSSGRAYARPARPHSAQNKVKGSASAEKQAQQQPCATPGRRRRKKNATAGATAAVPTVTASTADCLPVAAIEESASCNVATPSPEFRSSGSSDRPVSLPVPMRGRPPDCAATADEQPASSTNSQSPLGSSPGTSGSLPGKGRRARRNQRRAFEDAMPPVS